MLSTTKYSYLVILWAVVRELEKERLCNREQKKEKVTMTSHLTLNLPYPILLLLL